MYLSYYNLKTKPFQISTDPKFLWLGEKHREALAVLRYGIMDNKGFLLLTGDVGTGKTTLIHALINALGDEVVIANVPDPGLEIQDFFAYIARAFQLGNEFKSKYAFISLFDEFLNRAHDEKKRVLLIIDEAQRMSQELLEEIRLLSNIEKQSTKLINIFFVGQGEFNNIILEQRNSALRQRITVNFDLGPISEKETGEYVRHRLKIAGSAEPIFKPGAVKEIYRFSKGYPRLINVICDRALVTGYAGDSPKIGTDVIKECAGEMRLHKKGGRKNVSDRLPQAGRRSAAAGEIEKPRRAKKSLYFLLGVLVAVWIGIAVYAFSPDTFAHITGIFKTSRPIPVQLDDKGATHPIENSQPMAADEALDGASSGGEDELQTSSENQSVAADKVKTVQPEKFQLVFDKNVVLHITFNDENEMSADGFEILEKVAMVMTNDENLGIVMKGYSKSLGSYQYNQKMSEFSANIVKGYLVGKGVAPSRIETLGMVLLNAEENAGTKEAEKESRWVEIQFK